MPQSCRGPQTGLAHPHGYDGNNRLTSDQTGEGIESWGYDKGDNLTAIGTPSTQSTLVYDAAHELTSFVTTTSGATTQNLSLSYNANGDRIGSTDSISGTSRTYGYDGENRLTSFSQGSISATYSYNGDGLRMSKTVNGTPEAFTWDDAEGLPLILQDGSTKYVTGPDGLPLEQVTSSGVPYYYQDQLGSTRGLLDQSGTTAATYTYDAYGTVTSQTGTVATPFQYAGQYTDAESGLQYLRARYYDPSTAQFLTVDPLASVTGQPYSYAGGNTLSASDPSGLMPGAFGGGGGGMVPSWGAYDGIPMTGFAGYPVPDEPCTCGGDGLASLAGWLAAHPGVIAIILTVAAVIATIAGLPGAALALTVASDVPALVQVVLDVRERHYKDFLFDLGSFVAGLTGVRFAGLAWTLAGRIEALASAAAELLLSGNVRGAVQASYAALGLAVPRGQRRLADIAALRSAVAGLLLGAAPLGGSCT